MNNSVNPIPKGFHSVTPFMAVDETDALISFIESAFDGKVTERMRSDDGITRHCTVTIGDSPVMVSSGKDQFKPMPLMLNLFVENADQTYETALKAGAEPVEKPHNEFYGDRRAGVKDRWGNIWWIATRIEELSAEEIKRREQESHHSAENRD